MSGEIVHENQTEVYKYLGETPGSLIDIWLEDMKKKYSQRSLPQMGLPPTLITIKLLFSNMIFKTAKHRQGC